MLFRGRLFAAKTQNFWTIKRGVWEENVAKCREEMLQPNIDAIEQILHPPPRQTQGLGIYIDDRSKTK